MIHLAMIGLGQDDTPFAPASRSTTRQTIRIPVAGISCAGEAAGLERRLSKLDGVEQVTVNPVTNTIYITHDSRRRVLDDVLAEVADAGYQAPALDSNLIQPVGTR